MLVGEISSCEMLKRKREQNKIAQRKHRRKAREQLDALASLERLLRGDTEACVRQSNQDDLSCRPESADMWMLATIEEPATWDNPSPTDGEISNPLWLASEAAATQSSCDSSCHMSDSISESTLSTFDGNQTPHVASVAINASSSSDLDEMSRLNGLDVGGTERHSLVSTPSFEATGLTPLHVAAKEGHLDCVDLLLTCGSDVNQRDDAFLTALHHATLGGFIEVVQRLIRGGAQVDATDATGMTALHHASAIGDVAIVACLLDTDVALVNPVSWCL